METARDMSVQSMTGGESGRGLLFAGGVCAILWPMLSLAYYAAYPLAAGGAMLLEPGVEGALAIRAAQMGQRPAVVALEWIYALLPLLLWPFFAALYRLLGRRGQRDLALVAIGLGLLGIGLMTSSSTFNATSLHNLGQAYVGAGSQAEGAAILSTLYGLISWMRGLNQMSSLLYLASVALLSVALLRSRTWRAWGWVGLMGALLALPAKLPLGLQVPTNIIWTGLAYIVWPVALGIGLLRSKKMAE
jgi:hypothetical protein